MKNRFERAATFKHAGKNENNAPANYIKNLPFIANQDAVKITSVNVGYNNQPVYSEQMS